jgi:hypothetical protein
MRWNQSHSHLSMGISTPRGKWPAPVAAKNLQASETALELLQLKYLYLDHTSRSTRNSWESQVWDHSIHRAKIAFWLGEARSLHPRSIRRRSIAVLSPQTLVWQSRAQPMPLVRQTYASFDGYLPVGLSSTFRRVSAACLHIHGAHSRQHGVPRERCKVDSKGSSRYSRLPPAQH